MKTHTLLLIAIALVGSCLRSPCYAQSTTVRGQLLCPDGSPAAGLVVVLADKNGNVSTEWTTKADGMYYFYNVPFGDYFVRVVFFPKAHPFKAIAENYPVGVAFSPYNDLQRLTLPDYPVFWKKLPTPR